MTATIRANGALDFSFKVVPKFQIVNNLAQAAPVVKYVLRLESTERHSRYDQGSL